MTSLDGNDADICAVNDVRVWHRYRMVPRSPDGQLRPMAMDEFSWRSTRQAAGRNPSTYSFSLPWRRAVGIRINGKEHITALHDARHQHLCIPFVGTLAIRPMAIPWMVVWGWGNSEGLSELRLCPYVGSREKKVSGSTYTWEPTSRFNKLLVREVDEVTSAQSRFHVSN